MPPILGHGPDLLDALTILVAARPRSRRAGVEILLAQDWGQRAAQLGGQRASQRGTEAATPEEAAATIDALIRAGYVVETADALEFVAPERVIGEAAAAHLTQERRRHEELINLLERLPDLSRAYQLGAEPGDQAFQGEITRGADAAMERWFELASRLPPGAPSAVIPELRWIRDDVMPLLPRLESAFSAGGYPVRYLFHHSAAESADGREILDQLVSIGVTIRLAPRLPSWFYVDEDVMAALPTTWGADSPAGMAIVFTTPVVHAVHTLFASLWAGGSPYPLASEGWHAVLDLLAQGRSDEQAARALGLSLRTVRRRIAEAMNEFGVASRFELGAAWEAATS